MRNIGIGIVTITAILISANADARPLRPLSLGLGAEFSATNIASKSGGAITPSFGAGGNLRIDFLWALGIDLSANFSDSLPNDRRAAPLRLSGIVYVVPTETASLYLMGGISGHEAEDLLDFTGEDTTFHAGAGLEFYLTDGLAISFEAILLLPSLDEAKSTFADHVVDTVRGVDLTNPDPEALADDALDTAALEELIDWRNFQAKAVVRYYF